MIGASKSSALGNRARQFRKLLRARGGNAFARHVAWSRILSPEAESIFLDPAQSSDCDLRTISIARELARTASTVHRAMDAARVSLRCEEFVARLRVPNLGCVIAGSREYTRAVRTVYCASDDVSVSCESHEGPVNGFIEKPPLPMAQMRQCVHQIFERRLELQLARMYLSRSN